MRTVTVIFTGELVGSETGVSVFKCCSRCTNWFTVIGCSVKTELTSSTAIREVDSPQPPSPWDQTADPPDSTSIQVIYPWSEAYASSWVHLQGNKGIDNQLDNVPMEKDLEMGIARKTESQPIGPSKKALVANSDNVQSSQLNLSLKNDSEKLDKMLGISKDNPKGERSELAVNLPGDFLSSDDHHRGTAGFEIPTSLSEIRKSKDETMNDTRELPSL